MRTPMISVYYFDNKQLRDSFIKVSTKITHNNKICEQSSLFLGDFIALGHVNQILPEINELEELIKNNFGHNIPPEFNILLECLKNGNNINTFCQKINCPHFVPGYIIYTITLSLMALYQKADFQKTINQIILCGGDTDTNSFLYGSIFTLIHGLNQDESRAVKYIKDFPYNLKYIEGIFQNKTPFLLKKTILFPIFLIRNVLLIILVFIHIVMRLTY